jgi:hypothetical protein
VVLGFQEIYSTIIQKNRIFEYKNFKIMAAIIAQKLSPIQVHLLRFFSERNVNDQETNELQVLIANFYAQKADKLMESIWKEKGYSESKMLEILEQNLNTSGK